MRWGYVAFVVTIVTSQKQFHKNIWFDHDCRDAKDCVRLNQRHKLTVDLHGVFASAGKKKPELLEGGCSSGLRD